MSTAGKVLSILVTLAIVGLLVLFSMITSLNQSWGEKIQGLEKNVASLEDDLKTTLDEINRLKIDATASQRERERVFANLASQLSKLANADSTTKETLSRFTIQLTSVQQQVETAQRLQDGRQAELDQARRDTDEATAEVAKLKSENDALHGELTQLQRDFTSTLGENKRLIERLNQKTRVASVRRASLAGGR